MLVRILEGQRIIKRVHHKAFAWDIFNNYNPQSSPWSNPESTFDTNLKEVTICLSKKILVYLDNKVC